MSPLCQEYRKRIRTGFFWSLVLSLLLVYFLGVHAGTAVASEYQVMTQICDDNGANCQSSVWIPSTTLPVTDGWFGLQANSTEYWQVVTSFAVLMALIWSIKFLLRFITGRR
jgi:hypothetical protein